MDKETTKYSILAPEQLPQNADGDTDSLVERIIAAVKGYSPNANTDMIYIAYRLAKQAHKEQGIYHCKTGTAWLQSDLIF